ncbi:hypothetical protein E2N91_00275 [Pseudomonas syringae pv. tomato]|nr:hypothetical protein E2N91_00275 [Pseudomonas syringae pv. tomato]
MGMQFLTLRVTQRFYDVSWICLRLKSPFRPSATYFEGSKYAKSWLRFRPDFVGFLRPDTDPGVAATGHPWPDAACSASCLASPGSASGLSRHFRRNLRRQCHLRKKHIKSISVATTWRHSID